jgi:phosphoglycerate dehydrogenase-like enzyme
MMPRRASFFPVRLLFCGSGWHSICDDIAARLPPDMSISIWDRKQPLATAVADIEVILPSNAIVDGTVLRAAKKLKLVMQPASGYEAIDRDTARVLGVPVCNAPETNHISVAEAALYFMLALARKVKGAARVFGNAKIGEPIGIELRDKTVGIVGTGTSGNVLAGICRGLEMRVIGVDSKSSRDDFERLLSESDFVSIHCPLNERTRHLFDRAAFAKMKSGAILVNCARGPIIDKEALAQALASGQLGGAGLDTFWEEPWDPKDPIFARENVVTLPHVAGTTRESYARIADVVVDNVLRVQRGEEPRFRVA